MVKALQIFLFSVLLSAFTSFEGVSQTPFNAGLSVAANTTQIDGDGYKGFNKLGYQISIYGNRAIKENLVFELGIQYSLKGSFKPSRPDMGIFGTYRISMQYIEVPITFRSPFKDIVEIEYGLTAGYLLNTTEEDDNGVVPVQSLNYNAVEIAYLLGVHYDLTDRFTVAVRHSRSILPIADAIEITPLGIFGGSFNNLLALHLRYHFLQGE